jgi:hypothetical protein
MKRSVIASRKGTKERTAHAVRGGRPIFRGSQGPRGPKDAKDLRGPKGVLLLEAEDLAEAEERRPAPGGADALD